MSDPVVVKQNIQPAARIAIRNRIKSILVPNTDLGGRWWCSRPKACFLDELPCGLIYFTDESADDELSAPRSYKRTLNLKIEVLHRLESERSNALDDFLDSRAYEIEQVMFWDSCIGLQPLVEDSFYRRTEATDIKIEGDADIAAIGLYWDIIYRTDTMQTGDVDEFLRFYVDYEMKGGTEDTEYPRDEVEIRSE